MAVTTEREYRREYTHTLSGNLSLYIEEAAATVTVCIYINTLLSFNNITSGSWHLWTLYKTGKKVNKARKPYTGLPFAFK